MGKTIIHYDEMWAEALRGIVRKSLQACDKGLPGGHHFYITFRTRNPAVDISPALRARFPDEMTIVLQHQYWGLEITDEWFEVTLTFNQIAERLHIPFAAVSAFADPFAKFGIQIPTDAAVELTMEQTFGDYEAEEISEPTEAKEKPAAAPKAEGETGRVVTLDAFRKK